MIRIYQQEFDFLDEHATCLVNTLNLFMNILILVIINIDTISLSTSFNISFELCSDHKFDLLLYK